MNEVRVLLPDGGHFLHLGVNSEWPISEAGILVSDNERGLTSAVNAEKRQLCILHALKYTPIHPLERRNEQEHRKEMEKAVGKTDPIHVGKLDKEAPLCRFNVCRRASPCRNPAETLGFKSGDCDDFTILAAALFGAVGTDSAVAFFSHQDPEAEKQYHWMVQVHLDNLREYGYRYYSDLTSIGLAAGTWIRIKPQRTIENQHSKWAGQWNLPAAAPLD